MPFCSRWRGWLGVSVLQVQQADSILVVGGGTTGVEMAAELKTAHPHKKVTLCLKTVLSNQRLSDWLCGLPPFSRVFNFYFFLIKKKTFICTVQEVFETFWGFDSITVLNKII